MWTVDNADPSILDFEFDRTLREVEMEFRSMVDIIGDEILDSIEDEEFVGILFESNAAPLVKAVLVSAMGRGSVFRDTFETWLLCLLDSVNENDRTQIFMEMRDQYYDLLARRSQNVSEFLRRVSE